MRKNFGYPSIKNTLGLAAVCSGIIIIMTLVLPPWCCWLVLGVCLIFAGLCIVCRR